jgi:hypothetical protein
MAPTDMETAVAHPARVHDYRLAGKDHIAATWRGHRRRQPMGVMNAVYPITALYFGPLALAFYWRWARAARRPPAEPASVSRESVPRPAMAPAGDGPQAHRGQHADHDMAAHQLMPNVGARHLSTELRLSDGRPARHEPHQFARAGRNVGIHRANLLGLLAAELPGRRHGLGRRPRALAAYEELRRGRTARVQLGSRRNGAGYDSSGSQLTDRRWIYEYDAWAEAAALAGRL